MLLPGHLHRLIPKSRGLQRPGVQGDRSLLQPGRLDFSLLIAASGAGERVTGASVIGVVICGGGAPTAGKAPIQQAIPLLSQKPTASDWRLALQMLHSLLHS